jgi:hypothetical protein
MARSDLPGPDEPRSDSIQQMVSRIPAWIIGAGVAVALIVMLVAVSWKPSGDVSPEPVPRGEVESPPVLGGMVMPTATESSTVSLVPAPAASPQVTASIAAGIEVSRWQAGQVVGVRSPPLYLYADANFSSTLLDELEFGTVLVVLEPGGDYSHYPVVGEGVEWVRVRAQDGLVGWAATDQLELLR